jgi:hypothetical protein
MKNKLVIILGLMVTILFFGNFEIVSADSCTYVSEVTAWSSCIDGSSYAVEVNYSTTDNPAECVDEQVVRSCTDLPSCQNGDLFSVTGSDSQYCFDFRPEVGPEAAGLNCATHSAEHASYVDGESVNSILEIIDVYRGVMADQEILSPTGEVKKGLYVADDCSDLVSLFPPNSNRSLYRDGNNGWAIDCSLEDLSHDGTDAISAGKLNDGNAMGGAVCEIPQDLGCYDDVQTSNSAEINGCMELSSSNTLYTLTRDIDLSGSDSPIVHNGISTCFPLTAKNVVVDCDGYSITGNGNPNQYAISSYNPLLNGSFDPLLPQNPFSPLTLQNCTISGFTEDVYGVGGAVGPNYDNSGSQGLSVNVLNSNIESLVLDGADAGTGGGWGGWGGVVKAYGSTIDSIVSRGGDANTGTGALPKDKGGNGGDVYIKSSNINNTELGGGGFVNGPVGAYGENGEEGAVGPWNCDLEEGDGECKSDVGPFAVFPTSDSVVCEVGEAEEGVHTDDEWIYTCVGTETTSSQCSADKTPDILPEFSVEIESPEIILGIDQCLLQWDVSNAGAGGYTCRVISSTGASENVDQSESHNVNTGNTYTVECTDIDSSQTVQSLEESRCIKNPSIKEQ